MKMQHERHAAQIHGEYRWRKFNTTQLFDGSLQEAATALGLDEHEVAWAIEEFGRCDNAFPTEPDAVVCWKPGPIQTDNGEPDGEPIQGGFEWPATEAPASEED